MSNNDAIFHVDSVTVGGKVMPIQDGTATIEGAARYANSVVPAATGPDGTTRSRVPTVIKMKLLFKPGSNPNDYRNMSGVQIALKDSEGGRRCLATNCAFGSMGEIGAGPVDLSYNSLEELQWL